MDWIDLAQERDQRWSLVNMVMKLWVPYNDGKFFNSGTIATSQEGLSFMKLAMVIYKVNQEINVPILHSRH
jgi:hypothetical protein